MKTQHVAVVPPEDFTVLVVGVEQGEQTGAGQYVPSMVDLGEVDLAEKPKLADIMNRPLEPSRDERTPAESAVLGQRRRGCDLDDDARLRHSEHVVDMWRDRLDSRRNRDERLRIHGNRG